MVNVIFQPIEHPKMSNVINLKKTNDLDKLLRITAFVSRFVSDLKQQRLNKPIVLKQYVTVRERKHAMCLWLKENQLALQENK